jgi:hypothetical protein
MATFTATLSPPTGQTPTTNYKCRSGAVYVPSGGNVTVNNEKDFSDFVKMGWVVVTLTRI